MDMKDIVEKVNEFSNVRDWRQFHSPRNLVIALTGEVGELAELMAWRNDEEIIERFKRSPEKFRHEIADVLILTLTLCYELGVDPEEAILEKLKHNEKRYPIETTSGHGWKNMDKWK